MAQSSQGKFLTAVVRRFLAALEKDNLTGCWNWMGCKDKNGYGRMRVAGSSRDRIRVHRISYELFCDKIPEGLGVLHSCDNPACANPFHLWVGTNADNNADRLRKGRPGNKHGSKGEKNGAAKLNDGDVISIRADFRTGIYTRLALAEKYHVSNVVIGKILSGKTWSHVVDQVEQAS